MSHFTCSQRCHAAIGLFNSPHVVFFPLLRQQAQCLASTSWVTLSVIGTIAARPEMGL